MCICLIKEANLSCVCVKSLEVAICTASSFLELSSWRLTECIQSIMQQLLLRRAAATAFDPAQLQPFMYMSVFLAEVYMMKIQDASAIAQGMHSGGSLRMLQVIAMLNSKPFGCHQRTS